MIKTVLFLCTGNSCRSQMAEAIVNARLGQGWQAFSAGIKPAAFVHPKTIEVLAEIGISHAGRSKSMDEFSGQEFDLVVTVCDSAQEECPAWLKNGRQVHLDFPDPAQAAGSNEEVLQAFREVRDGIIRQIIPLLEQFS